MDRSPTTERQPTAQEMRVFLGVGAGPRELLSAQDAEILALDGPGAADDGPLPTLTGGAGPVSVAATDEPATDPDAASGVDLADVLDLRRVWISRLELEQVTELGTAWVIAYLRSERYALVEDVQPTGVHRFLAAKQAAALDALVASLWAFPEIGDEQGPAVRYTLAEWEERAPELLAGAGVATTVVAARRADQWSREPGPLVERRFLVYTLPTRNVTVLDDGEGVLSVATTSRRQLRRLLAAACAAERLVHP